MVLAAGVYVRSDRLGPLQPGDDEFVEMVGLDEERVVSLRLVEQRELRVPKRLGERLTF